MTPAPTPARRGMDDVFRSAVRRLLLVAILVTLAGQLAVSLFSARSFENYLVPEVKGRALITGQRASTQIQEAVDLGIPLRSLVGMEAYLSGLIADNPTVERLWLLSPEGETLYADGGSAGLSPSASDNRMTVPVVSGETEIGAVVVGLRAEEAPLILVDLRFEIATVLLVSLLIGIEFLAVFGFAQMSAPTRFLRDSLRRAAGGDFTSFVGISGQGELGRIAAQFNRQVRRVNGEFSELSRESEEVSAEQLDRSIRARIAEAVESIRGRNSFVEVGDEQVRKFRSPFDVRIALLFYMISQELSRPFLPLVFDRVHDPLSSLSREVFIGLPITGFMLVVLLVTPFAGAIAERVSVRTLFLAGLLPSMAAYFGTGHATDMYAAMAWWILGGVGYGVIFISAQVYVAAHSESDMRAAGMAVFSGAVFTAFVCGPAIGGLLADRLGYVNTLLAAGGLAAVSGLFAFLSLDSEPVKLGVARRGRGLPRPGQIAKLLGNRSFFAIAFLSALPAKVALTGVFFYLVPVYLHELGESQSVIGRIMMAYGVVCVAVAPLVARFSDRLRRTDVFVTAGGVFVALGCLIPALREGYEWVLAGVAVLGLGHALLTAPQLAAVQGMSERVGGEVGLGGGSILGVFRTCERLGAALGAVLLATLVSRFGYGAALGATAAGILALCGLYAGLAGMSSLRSRRE